jgi:apolipoprotein N-acyltransferase
MTIYHPELALLAWGVRILGTLGVLCLLLLAGYWLVRALLNVAGRWRTYAAMTWLWYYVAKRDRAKLLEAAEKWGAWNLPNERQREVKAAEDRLHRLYQNRERYLREHYDIPDDVLDGRDSEGHPLAVVWEGMPEWVSPEVGTSGPDQGTDSRDDLL